MKVTVVAGYLLFIFLLASLVVSSIWPFMALFRPEADQPFFATLLLSWMLGGLVPSLLGYYLGSHETYRKNKLLHHYNGVLFGAVSYWLASTIILPISASGVNATSGVWGPVIVNVVPAAIAVMIMTIVGVLYAKRSSHQQSLLSYRPYQGVVLLTLLLLIVTPLLLTLTGESAPAHQWIIAVAVQTIVLLAIVSIAYLILPSVHPHRLRWTHATVLTGMLTIFFQCVTILVHDLMTDWYTMSLYLTVGASLAFYFGYLLLQRRALRSLR